MCKKSVAMPVVNSKVSAGQNNIYKLGLMSDICVCIKNPSEVLQNCMLKYCLLFHFQLYVTNVDLHCVLKKQQNLQFFSDWFGIMCHFI